MRIQDIISLVQEYHPSPDLEVIRRAYSFVRRHHKGQTRASGEPYVTHVTEVAYLAAKLRLDEASIATGLLHDTVEDTDISLEDIREEFGEEVSALVDGVTKLSRVNFRSRAEAQAENFRKMLLAMASDIRVLLLKLCDRTHNMRTLEFLSETRRMRIAQETLEIYAPLAHRLGIHWMKSELEDLAFRHLKPEIYEQIKRRVKTKKEQRERYIQEVVTLLTAELEQNGVKGAVSGRPKHFFSIYQKMEHQELDFDDIYDLIAFRIIVDSTMQCYAALGVVHAAWKPIPGRFKDYIAMPKPNGYQSLHTTVIGPRGTRIEIQIRTDEMHEIAEKGIAAHWAYKEGAAHLPSAVDTNQFPWLADLVESEQRLEDPLEFLSSAKESLFSEEVFVFTPQGDVIALPGGATPLDFAYQIHSEVGNQCGGARVNGQQVALSYVLHNGDTIEVITSNRQQPSKDWLNIVVTSKAKQRIRAWLRSEARNRAISVGRELLLKDLPKFRLNIAKLIKSGELKRTAEELGFRDEDALLAEVGYGKLVTKQVVSKLLPEESDIDEKLAQDESALKKIFNRAAKAFRDKNGVKVSGLEDVVLRFARCCEPLPGDALVGYVTRGRGVTIHAEGCSQTHTFDPQRLIPVEWDENATARRLIKIDVLVRDRVGMLALMSTAISTTGANIVNASSTAYPDGKALSAFEVSLENARQLDEIVRALERIDGVLRVARKRKAQH